MKSIIENKLMKMNKKQLQKIYHILYGKNIHSSKQNIIKELIQPLHKKDHKYKIELIEYQKPLKKFEYTGNNCWSFTHKPDVDISKVNNDAIYEIEGKKIQLYNRKYLDVGSHGSVYLLSDSDNEYYFALKKIKKKYTEDSELIIDEEIPIIKEIENKKISCNVVPAKILDDDCNFWYVIMPKYEGNLSKFVGKLNSFEIINLGIELGAVYNCLLRNGLYYADSKPSQVLYKCVSGNTFSIALGDLGSISHKDEYCLQTFPYPPKEYYYDFYIDAEKASEHVVVWGFIIMLLMMINKEIDSIILEYLYWNKLRITTYKNTFEIFQIYISRLLQKHPMKDFFETFLGIKKNLYEMVENGEYTMNHVIEYLSGYPFLIRTTKDVISERNLSQLQKLSTECWKHISNMNGEIYTVYVNSEIVSYGVLDKDNTLWSLCTSSKSRGKGYAKKIIDEMFRDVCNKGGQKFYLFVDENSPKKWYEKMGFKYIELSPLEKEEYGKYGKYVQKMYKKCF